MVPYSASFVGRDTVHNAWNVGAAPAPGCLFCRYCKIKLSSTIKLKLAKALGKEMKREKKATKKALERK
jgi:hypothetical protein